MSGDGLVVTGLAAAVGRPPRRLWRGVSFRVPPGSSAAVRGASGSGKSTLLASLVGLRPVVEGTVVFADVDLSLLTRRRHRRFFRDTCCFVPQDDLVSPEMTIREALDPVRGWTTGRRSFDADVARALERVGLGGRGAEPTAVLSGGERSRVALARVVLRQRELIVLDEPTAALDGAAVRDVLDVLDELRHGGASVVVATHDPVIGAWADLRVDLAARRVRPRRAP